MLAEPASDIKTCDHYEQFPLYLAGDAQQHYGIPHGFSSRMALERFLNGLFGENLAVSMMMGAAYGYFLDYCRRLFRVAPYQQAKA